MTSIFDVLEKNADGMEKGFNKLEKSIDKMESNNREVFRDLWATVTKKVDKKG